MRKKSSKEALDKGKQVIDVEKEPLDKGKQIVIEDDNEKINNANVNRVGPSNSKLISMETIINRAGFIGVNNVPMNSKEALSSARPLLGFINEEAAGVITVAQPQQGSGQKEVADTVSSSSDIQVAETQFHSGNLKQPEVNSDPFVDSGA